MTVPLIWGYTLKRRLPPGVKPKRFESIFSETESKYVCRIICGGETQDFESTKISKVLSWASERGVVLPIKMVEEMEQFMTPSLISVPN